MVLILQRVVTMSVLLHMALGVRVGDEEQAKIAAAILSKAFHERAEDDASMTDEDRTGAIDKVTAPLSSGAASETSEQMRERMAKEDAEAFAAKNKAEEEKTAKQDAAMTKINEDRTASIAKVNADVTASTLKVETEAKAASEKAAKDMKDKNKKLADEDAAFDAKFLKDEAISGKEDEKKKKDIDAKSKKDGDELYKAGADLRANNENIEWKKKGEWNVEMQNKLATAGVDLGEKEKKSGEDKIAEVKAIQKKTLEQIYKIDADSSPA